MIYQIHGAIITSKTPDVTVTQCRGKIIHQNPKWEEQTIITHTVILDTHQNDEQDKPCIITTYELDSNK